MNRLLVALFFCASGASGLIYEVIWSRHLENLFGVSTFAITTVVAAYMVGLGLGSLLFGRIADRQNASGCVATYGLLEIAIGLFAFVFTPLIGGVAAVYRGVAVDLIDNLTVRVLIDFLLAFGLLLVPTILMGGTLPLIARFFATEHGRTSRGFGAAYALNTAGAVFGVWLSGFVLLESLGLVVSLYACGVLNVTIGLAAWLTARRHAQGALPSTDEEPQRDLESEHAPRATIALAALSGCIALGCEIAWIRGFASLMLSTTHTFSLVLIVFLIGITLGSWIGSRLRPTRTTIAFAFLGLGASALTQLLLYSTFWEMLFEASAGTSLHADLIWRHALIVAITVLPLTVFSGALLPLIVGSISQGVASSGRDVGRVYIANTVGSLTGTIVCGFLLIPGIGAIAATRGFSVLALVAALLGMRRGRTGATLALAASAVAALALLWPAPSRLHRAISPTVVGRRVGAVARRTRTPISKARRAAEDSLVVLDLRHGIAADSSVMLQITKSNTLLYINGMPNASTGGDQATQMSLAVMPYLFAPRVANAMHIGLGSGITAGAWAALPGTEQVEIVELEQQLWEQAALFEPYTFGLRERKNAAFVADDARARLEIVPERSLDVVSSQPSQLWVKGVGNLFTTEFFELVKTRLREDGLFVTWMMGYDVPGHVWAVPVATLLDSFPHVEALLPPGSTGDVVFLCSTRPMSVKRDRIEAIRSLSGAPAAIRNRLAPIDPATWRIANNDTLRRETERVLRSAGIADLRNTVTRPVVEFQFPRYLMATSVPNGLLEALRGPAARPKTASERFVQRLEKDLDRIVELATKDANQLGIYVDRFLRALPRQRLMEVSMKDEYFAALVNAALGSRRADVVEAYLRAANEQHGGRLACVATALADLLSRIERPGAMDEARRVFATYRETAVSAYIGAVRKRLFKGGP